MSNYAFKRTAELALGSKQLSAPQPLNAALELRGSSLGARTNLNIIAFFASMVFCTHLLAIRPLPPLNNELIVGAWVGPNVGPSVSDTYGRIVIEDSGKGLITVLWGEPADGRIVSYRIKSMELDGPLVKIFTEPSPTENSLQIEGTTRLGGMDLKVIGGSRGDTWSQSVHLEREESLLDRLRAVQVAAPILSPSR